MHVLNVSSFVWLSTLLEIRYIDYAVDAKRKTWNELWTKRNETSLSYVAIIEKISENIFYQHSWCQNLRCQSYMKPASPIRKFADSTIRQFPVNVSLLDCFSHKIGHELFQFPKSLILCVTNRSLKYMLDTKGNSCYAASFGKFYRPGSYRMQAGDSEGKENGSYMLEPGVNRRILFPIILPPLSISC